MSRSYITIIGLIIGFLLITFEQSRFIEPGTPLYNFISVIAYSVVGVSVLFLSYKVLDWILPADVEKEIFEKNNIAAAIFKSILILGVAIIISAVIVSP
jgi:uncharacterized membrane protein YjfL (UPF0719 family)